MEIRKATIEDAACISSIFWESWQTGYRGLIDQAYLDGLRPDHWQAFFASQLQPGSLEAQVAMLGPEAAGAVAYGAFIPPTGSQVPARGDGYVQALYVRPAFMRQGVGSGLLQAAEEGLRDTVNQPL